MAGGGTAGYLTLRELAGRLGMPTTATAMKRLRRRLAAKQRHTPRQFLLRLTDAPNAPLLTTEALMRQWCPEFFDRRSEARAMLDEWTEEFRESLAELKAIQRGLGARYRQLQQRIAQLEAAHGSVAARPVLPAETALLARRARG
jgi:hypothetical protein